MTRQLRIYLILKLFRVILVCNAQSNANDFTKVYNTTDLKWLHDQNGKIAVPTGHEGEIMHAPNRSPNKTKIDIEMFAVEIIEFDVKLQQFTIRMGVRVNWSENRLKLDNSSLTNGWMNVQLNTVWSPQIDIQSVEVSEKRKQEIMEVKMDSQSQVSMWKLCRKRWNIKKLCGSALPYDIHYFMQSSSARMKFSLTTTVKCSMNFTMFPFDSHFCKLKVSSHA